MILATLFPFRIKIITICLAIYLTGSLNSFASQAAMPENYEASQKSIDLTDQEKDYLKSAPTLSVPLIAQQPPLSYIENGKPAGYLNALFERVASILNLQYTRTTNYSYSASISALQSDKVDLLNDYSSYGEKRDSILNTTPVLNIPFVAVGPSINKTTISSIDYLKDKKLVLVSGFQQTKTIQQRYPDLKFMLVDSIDLAYRALRNKEADYYIDNATHAGYFLSSQIITDLHIAGEFPAIEMGVLELSFAVRSDQPILFSAIQKALNAIDQNEIHLMQQKWVVNHQNQALQLNDSERRWLNRHPEIRLATDSNWLPFEAIQKNGKYGGISSDYMKLIETLLDIKFTPSPAKPWNQITKMVKTRELDVFTMAMETEPRKQYAIFTQPYLSHPMIIATRDNIGYVDGLKGLRGKVIAIENGYASYDLLSSNNPDLELQTHPDSLSAILAVSNGSAFAYIGNIASLSHILRSKGITNIKISGQVPYNFELSMGVRSDWPELVPILQKALDSITLEEKNIILNKWIGFDLKQDFDYTLVWQISAAGLVVFIYIIYWNLLLKRKVKERTRQLEHQAHYDPLTKLPNRVLALDRLSLMINEAYRKNNKVALLFLDLDDFKKINDTMGHSAGDHILIDAAERLRKTIRSCDTVARLGGDEFIILLGDLKQSNSIKQIAETLIDKFRSAFIYEDRELLLTASLGIAIYPDDGKTPSDLLRNADSAMYHSKRQGRNTYNYFNQSMNDEVTRRLLLEEYMSGALDNNEFSVLYQPKVEIDSLKIIGAEALLRWHNPLLGEISPVEFIPVAEQNGMIIPIGQFVLSTALQVSKHWRQKFRQPLVMAVNMSPRQFRDPALVEVFSSIIKQSGAPENALELEITEGVLMSGHSIVDDALNDLKHLGISLAMDDFGTGYSSLSYLRKFPFDVLKIDHEFIKDITIDKSDLELVHATIDMAKALGLKVVAEGVETIEQLELLRARGCELAQGYLFSKPLTEQQFFEKLQDENFKLVNNS